MVRSLDDRTFQLSGVRAAGPREEGRERAVGDLEERVCQGVLLPALRIACAGGPPVHDGLVA